MSTIYKTQRQFADHCMPQIKALLGQSLIEDASFEDDTQNSVDLIVRKMHISVRIRRTGYGNKYNDFTIRVTTQTNQYKSEYAKLLKETANSPDYIFYGFMDGERITRAYLIDIKKFRTAIKNGMTKHFKRNPDRSSFLAFPLHADYTRALVIG